MFLIDHCECSFNKLYVAKVYIFIFIIIRIIPIKI
jgi:hypothetical protein